MKDSGAAGGTGFLTTLELAGRPDFQLGDAIVSPSRRVVSGPGGSAEIEPRVMQVLLVLADAKSAVVTRALLFDRCWGSPNVGDDSLNRAIAGVRRIASDIAGGSIAIETIPRTGYRLIPRSSGLSDAEAPQATPSAKPFSRRAAIATGVVTVASVGATAWWSRSRQAERFDTLMRRGEDALAKGKEDLSTTALFQEAVNLRPDSARAWGLLAYTKVEVIESSAAAKGDYGSEDAREAANRALALNPDESNALLTLALLQEWIDGWAAFDQRLRYILKTDPSNAQAMTALVALLQAAGLTRESWAWNQRQSVIQPSSPVPIWRRAFKLWIMGSNADAYRVIERASEIWPRDPGVWNAKLVIFAFSDRARAALNMLDEDPAVLGPAKTMAVWRASLEALESRAPAAIERATQQNLAAAKRAPGLAVHAAMVLGALGQTDAAYQIAEGFLLSRGQVLVQRPTSSLSGMIASRGWKWTQWLFTPPAASLRGDPRFAPLCDAVGLSEYWKARKVKPDYLTQRT